ncbi:MAG: FMN-binding glutamate synthase family protein [Alphaproteobacteria bacterium]|nr:FMN-binding glutamate synthase family protein [Alphaproteobacteria bacterium]MBO6628588.1 FMN-binding glutamate synthase family protein [Alphaproteobacteria bacterium]MDF1626806.1 FMN-binding glutamate synthase family protein [Parvibaculaceae bacterium]
MPQDTLSNQNTLPAPDMLLTIVDLMSALFLFGVGLAVLGILVMYVVDRTQTTHAIRRNYPVIGRFRYVFENLGEYFRQYFFAMDREEMPFNRAQRAWVYRAAKGVDTTVAFGSTRDLKPTGTISFVNCPFPTLDEDATEPQPVKIGPYCDKPYITASLFNISGMSYGAISKPAVLALSKGAAAAGCWMNTGEGALSKYHLKGGADIVFQIGTAKYGVRDAKGKLSDAKLKETASIPEVKMFEIKMSQGAKPGKGGILPGAKVTKEIAAARGIPAGKDSISPNRHPEIDSVDQLLDMVNHVRKVTGKPVGFKFVMGGCTFLDDLFSNLAQRPIEEAPDFITLDSADGGTGASPQALIDYVGMPIWESLPILVDKLTEYGLRSRIKVIASGKLINPSDVAWALSVGADFITSARGFMFSLGCIQALQCNKNTCPTGITTHNKKLQRGLDPKDKAERVRRYQERITSEVCIIAHSCGVAEPRLLKRKHARINSPTGFSMTLDEYYRRVMNGEMRPVEARPSVAAD